MIRAKDIKFSYENLEVLKGIDLDVKKGDFISIVGASGAGKTTLLQILGTLEKFQEGSLIINNQDVSKLAEKEIAKFRNQEIGFIFQFHNLLNEFTALENVCIPSYLSGVDKKKADKKGLELLERLNLRDRAKHKPNELSGGEQQRVAVARALINSPSILLADEPSGNLDSNNANELHNLLLEINKETEQSIIVITHNINLAKITNKQLEMKDGKLFS